MKERREIHWKKRKRTENEVEGMLGTRLNCKREREKIRDIKSREMDETSRREWGERAVTVRLLFKRGRERECVRAGGWMSRRKWCRYNSVDGTFASWVLQ